MGLLAHLLARLTKYDGTSRRVLLECQVGERQLPSSARALFFTAPQLARAPDRDLAQDRRMNHLVQEPHLQRLLRADVASGENHVERVAKPHEPWQPLRAAGTGNEPEHDLGKCEHRLRVIGSDAPGARHRRLEAAPQAGAMNRRHHRRAELLQAVEQRLPVERQPLRVLGRANLQKLLDVGAGDEGIGLAAQQDRPVNRCITLEPAHELDEILLHDTVELVHRLVREIHGDDSDAVLHLHRHRAGLADDVARSGRSRGGHPAFSRTMANPMPPAAHTVMRPNWPPRRRSSLMSVIVMRAPVAPKGWPMAIEPPMTLRRARSTSPTGCRYPARCAHSRDSSP